MGTDRLDCLISTLIGHYKVNKIMFAILESNKYQFEYYYSGVTKSRVYVIYAHDKISNV